MIERLCGSEGLANVEGRQVVHDGEGGVQWRSVTAPGLNFEVEAEAVCELAGKDGEGAFAGIRWRWELGTLKRGAALRFGEGREWFDAGKVGGRVTLRHWRRVDRFQPIGMERAVKLQDLFTNMKVPREERHRRVVAVTAEGTIWWVEELRIGEMFKIQPGTGRFLKWTWNRDRQGRKGS